MKAIGMIETRGLLAAIESADAMLKAAEVALIDRAFVGGGLVTITVSGDVAAVKASVDAGAAAVQRIGGATLVSQHVIPRPHEELNGLVVPVLLPDEGETEEASRKEPLPVPPKAALKETQQAEKEETPARVKAPATKPAPKKEPAVVEMKAAPKTAAGSGATGTTDLDKKAADNIAKAGGVEALVTALKGMRVVKLRTLAREYNDLGIAGRAISEANKQQLLEELTKYYKK